MRSTAPTSARTPRRSRRRALAGVLGAVALWSTAAPALAQDPSLEYVVKANYLYKFTPFIEWPPRAFAGPRSPFNICIVGQDPFGAALDAAAAAGRVMGDHPVVVRRLNSAGPRMECHLLFAGRSALQTTEQILATVAGQPILTVTDGQGGMIRFVTQGGRVRFDVDVAAAQASGITISSKLLALAVSNRRSQQ